MVLVQKWPFFQIFSFLGNVGQKNVFHDILERKKAFLRYKNQKFKSRKIDISSKGLTHGFFSKNGHFANFLFRQYRARKCLLRYSRTKKGFSTLWKQEVQKSKNWHFSKGINPWFGLKMAIFPAFFFKAI